jgi:signal transduction histidine kinase
LVFFWILFFSINKYRKSKKELKGQILLFSIGIEFFLLFFFISGYLSSYLLELGIPDFSLEQYGLFGMIVFLGFLSYLIVKYQAFDIKVIAAQFLTVTVWIAVFSQFFIVQELSNQILTGATLGLVTIFGHMLFKAIKEDVTLTEQLRVASGKLAVLNAKLKEIDAAKSEFISIASHQLRTPLTSVKGYASLILENTFGKAPLRQREAVEKLYVNNEKLVLLVEDMLNASRLEAGRLEYEFEEVDMPPLVKEVVDNMQLHAKSKDLSLKYIAPLKNGLIALADKRKVAEIIANLIDNAVKYSEKGGITVSVERCELAKPVGNVKNTNVVNGAGVRVSVADTGIGLNEKELKEIFEKFKGGGENAAASPKQSASLEKIVPSLRRRGEGEVKTPDKKLSTSNFELSTNIGTGLGVYISRQMARAMGGDLHAESPGKGKGSTFILELSLVKK